MTRSTTVELDREAAAQRARTGRVHVVTVTYDSATKVLLMGKPLTFTKETAGDYNF